MLHLLGAVTPRHTVAPVLRQPLKSQKAHSHIPLVGLEDEEEDLQLRCSCRQLPPPITRVERRQNHPARAVGPSAEAHVVQHEADLYSAPMAQHQRHGT